jgi:hypothetical protein
MGLLVLFHQQKAARAFREESAAAQAQAAETARLQTELERSRASEAEVKRLREESRELVRLRGEVARLRRELAAATGQAAEAGAPRAAQSPPPAGGETNDVAFTGTARATLAPGQTLVVGGWPLERGKRTLALFTPDASKAGQHGTLIIGGLFVQVPEALLSGPGWQQFQAVTREANNSGVFDADQTKQFVKALESLEGVEILSAPKLATTSGTAGTISIGDDQGSGLTTALLPTLAADGQTVDLMVSNSLRRASPPPAGERPR